MEVFFKPITVNKLTIPNRFAMAPMTRSRSPDGVPGDNVRDYYQRRAAGEVGLIITEGVEVSHPSSSGYPDVPGFRDKADEGETRIDAVHVKAPRYFSTLARGSLSKTWHDSGRSTGYTPSGLSMRIKQHTGNSGRWQMLIDCCR